MRYEQKEQFEKVNTFGTGTANTAYAQYFTGDSFLNPLTDPEATTGISTTRTKEAVSSCSARLARAGTRRKARPPSACTRAAS